MIHLIDSNVYIHGFRDSVFGETLRQFHQKHLPHLILSARRCSRTIGWSRERYKRKITSPRAPRTFSDEAKTARAGPADMGDGSEH